MKRTIFLYIFLVLSIPAHAQILVVRDNVTHQPLELVHIYSMNSRAFAITDVRGRADLLDFTEVDTIRVEMIGYQSITISYSELQARRFILYLSETPILMNPVVVTTTRWQQENRNVPNKTVAIRPAQMHMHHPQTAADLLELSGEVYIQKSQLGGGSPMIRGFAANRVLIVIDGVRMNTAIFRSGNLQNVISVDPFALEKTEIVFGPGSTVYGSDAIGGVMGFYTLEPKLSSDKRYFVKGNATVRTSSADLEKTGHVDVNIGTRKWAFITSASYADFDDLTMGSDGPDDYLRKHYIVRKDGRDSVVANPDPREQVPTGYHLASLMQKIRFKPDEKWDFTHALHYSTSSDIPRYDRLIEYRDDRLRDAEWYYGPQQWLMNALNIQHTSQTNLYDNVRLTLAQQFFEESRHNRNYGATDRNHRTETVRMISANLDVEKSFSRAHRLFYGSEIILNSVASKADRENIETRDRQPISTRYPDGATWNSYAIYLNFLYYATHTVTFQIGSRYNQIRMDADFDTTFYPFEFTSANLNTGALTGSMGMVYHPNKDWEISLNASTGFRAPNVDDMSKVFDSEPGSVIVPNPGLKPEYAYNADFSVAKLFGDVAKVTLSNFYMMLDRALVRRNFTLNGCDSIFYDGTASQVQAIQNAAQANVWGTQVGIEIKFPARFSMMSRFNYQHGEEELDDGSTAPLRHAGPWFGSTHLTYSRERFKVDLYGIYNGEVSFVDLAPSEANKPHLYARDKDGNPYSPGWHTVNLKVMYQITDFLMMSLGTENFADKRYRCYSSGISAPGRNFILALKATF